MSAFEGKVDIRRFLMVYATGTKPLIYDWLLWVAMDYG